MWMRRHAERRRMMLGEVVAENPGAIRHLEQLQTLLVKLLQRDLAPFQVVENSKCDIHGGGLLRR
jgi:hypothetical protein